ncbi:MAG: DUF4159 domain-containing protein [Acidobacteria bacterium]|nr:DUF4159 domain-containing protein [Acidobacteriota bacterium]
MKKKVILAVVLLSCFFAWSARMLAPSADEGGDPKDRLPHPSHFYFARVQFNSYFSGWNPGWAHDYPRAERNFLKILSEVSSIRTTPDSYKIVRLDDPEIMRFPFLYFSEPGTWAITPEEAKNLREYLQRGGFAIFDDFDGPRDWYIFQKCMNEVLPGRPLEQLTLDHHVFHCFYDIKTLDMVPPYEVQGKPTFYGISDEKGRLQVVVNFNNDMGDFWEWSDEEWVPVNLSNEAYKFGVNYVIYALTH